MKSTIILTILFLLIACTKADSNAEIETRLSANIQTTSTEKKTDDCVTMDFHYLIAHNELYSSKVRNIKVFLDEKAFSEENLKKLFRVLSDKNPEPKRLIVEVKTNWKQLDFPSDCPGTGASNMPVPPDKFDYFQAMYHRFDRKQKSEYFEYYPILKSEDFKTVLMK